MRKPTFADYDRHLYELDQAAVTWEKEAAKESDPVFSGLCRKMARHTKQYAETLRALLAHVRAAQIKVHAIRLDARNRN